MVKSRIRVTRTLLDRDKGGDELTCPERRAVDDYKDLLKYRDRGLTESNNTVSRDCRILCSQVRSPIPSYGWIGPVSNLCYSLEKLNIDNAKYGIRVVLTQSKEKFGTLRFYTNLDIQPVGLAGLAMRPFAWLASVLHKLDYGMKTVVDRDAYKTVEWNEITKSQFDERTDSLGCRLDSFGCSVEVAADRDSVTLEACEDGNTTFLVEEDGRYYMSSILYHCARTHVEWTRHRILHRILRLVDAIQYHIGDAFGRSMTQRVAIQAVDNEVERLVDIAEVECSKRCEQCGTTFVDTDEYDGDYVKCETLGWITYVCENCALARGGVYRKRGKLYKEGVEVEPDDKENGNG